MNAARYYGAKFHMAMMILFRRVQKFVAPAPSSSMFSAGYLTELKFVKHVGTASKDSHATVI